MEIDDLDHAARLAREEAFKVAPRGCTCTHTTKLLNLRGDCPWCLMYWTERLRLEATALSVRLQAIRERIAETKKDFEQDAGLPNSDARQS